MKQSFTITTQGTALAASRVAALVCAAGFLALLGLVLASRPVLTYDEPDYIATVGLLQKYGLSLRFLQEYPVAAGPLFGVVHWLASPLTHLQAPGVRVLQVALIGLSTMLLAMGARRLGWRAPWLGAAAILAVPMVFTVSGMALTEIPAVLLSAAGIALLLSADARGEGARRLLEGCASGIALGLAATGRQPLFVVLFLIPLLAVRGRWRWHSIVLSMTAGAVLPLTLFVAWGGFVSPQLAHFDGFSPRNGIMASAYACAALFFLRPRMLRVNWKFAVGILMAAAAGNLLFGVVDFVPLRATLTRLAPSALPMVGRIGGSGALVAALLFLVAISREAWRSRHDGARLFLACSAFAVIAANVKVSYFSTRYVVPAVPFLALAGIEEEDTGLRAPRLAAGFLLGATSLFHYLFP